MTGKEYDVTDKRIDLTDKSVLSVRLGQLPVTSAVIWTRFFLPSRRCYTQRVLPHLAGLFIFVTSTLPAQPARPSY